MNEPQYQVDKMVIRETRSFHLHAGKDLYPLVGNYLQATIAGRMDTVRHMAVMNRILVQAEEEGKEYITALLHELGRPDIVVRFADEEGDVKSAPVQHPAAVYTSLRKLNPLVEAIPFGFLPIH
jgi:hypothetical protein